MLAPWTGRPKKLRVLQPELAVADGKSPGAFVATYIAFCSFQSNPNEGYGSN